MNTIALVCHGRPELLKIHLEQLLKNPELKDFLVHFFPDYGFNPEILKVIKWFKSEHKHIKVTTRSLEESKKSPLPAFYNIFDAYRIAAKEADEFVLPAEEDIVPTDDYLRYHIAAYKNFLSRYDKIFCTTTKRRHLNEKIGNPELLIGDIQLCQPTCITKKTIENILCPLMEDELFWTPWEFNRIFCPNYRHPPEHHIHHDGQLERIAEINGMFCLKPDQARSAHIGISGQHFKGNVQGKTLEEKIAYMKNIMRNGDLLRAASDNPKDMCTVRFESDKWTDLRLDLDRNQVLTQVADFDPENKFKEYILSCKTQNYTME